MEREVKVTNQGVAAFQNALRQVNPRGVANCQQQIWIGCRAAVVRDLRFE